MKAAAALLRGGRGGRLCRVPGLGALALGVAAASAGAAGWPRPAVPPVPAAAPPEAVRPAERQAGRGIEESLRSLLREPSPPPAPGEPAPELVEWLGFLCGMLEEEELLGLERSGGPAAWAAADPGGALSLPAALALAEAGRAGEALAWIARDDPQGDRLHAELLRIELLAQLGDSAAAAARSRALLADRGEDRLALPAARLLIRWHQGRAEADSLLRTGLRLRRLQGPGADEMAARVRALRSLGREPEARLVADTLIRDHPWARTAREEAERRLDEDGRERLLRDGRDLVPVFLRHGLLEEAERLLSLWPDEIGLRLDALERMLALRRYEAILAEPYPPPPDSDRGASARWLLVHARAARNAGAQPRMAAYYRRAAALGAPAARTALTEWAREAESEADDRLADSLYTLLMEIPGEAEEARFRRGIARFAAGRLLEAAEDLRTLERAVGNGGAPFWRYRVAQRLGDSAGAAEALREGGAGTGYYGGRCREETAHLAAGGRTAGFWAGQRSRFLRPSPAALSPSARIDCAEGPELRRQADRVRLFRRFGRQEWADRERERLEGMLGAADRGRRLHCLGLPDLALRIGIATGSTDPVALYPRAFPALVAEEAARCGIAPALVWAIARRESLFDPAAESTAGAVGLLQLMGATARETAGRWGIAGGPLRRPDRNVPLGVRHLADLFSEEDRHLPAVLAAYNAGMAKCREWIARFEDVDLFIERIGWWETRAYVRHVLDAAWKYADAYGGGSAGIDRGTGDPEE